MDVMWVCVVVGMSGVAGPVPVTTSSSQAAQSLRKPEEPLVAYGPFPQHPQATLMCGLFPLRPLLCILRLKERRTG